NPGNTAFVDDPNVKPPLKVRWAVRGFGHFLTPCITTEEDMISTSFGGIVTCLEQATGRMRWRRALPGTEWGTSSGPLVADGRIYVPRPMFNGSEGTFHCLDVRDGRLLWSADTGFRYIWERNAPVLAAGNIAFGFGHKGKPPGTFVQAWNAVT